MNKSNPWTLYFVTHHRNFKDLFLDVNSQVSMNEEIRQSNKNCIEKKQVLHVCYVEEMVVAT